MKKFLSLFLSVLMLLSLSACGASREPDNNKGPATPDIAPGAPEAPEGGQVPGEMPDAPEGGQVPGEMPDALPDTLIENSFVLTDKEPVSTISSDADTASYSFLRALIQSGLDFSEIKNYKNHLRTEEIVNYFDYDCPFPQGDDLFGHQFLLAPCPYNPQAKLLMLRLKAAEATVSKSNNFVFLIDVSGSMFGENKLPLLKKSFSLLTEQLGADDRISIVTYAGSEKVVLEGCKGSEKERILSAINGLSASGSTNGEGGIEKAYAIAEKYYIEGGNNRIFLASDGDFNVGISSYEELKVLISDKRQKDLFFSVFGFGIGNYRDQNMEVLADCGNGAYYYIDSEEEAGKVFGEKLCTTLYTVARDLKLQLHFNPETVEAYRLVGYENRVLQNEDFENDRKDAGDIGSGYTLTVCYELILTENAREVGDFFGVLKIRYKKPNETESIQKEFPLPKSIETKEPDKDFRFVSELVTFSLLLRDSPYLKTDVTLENIVTSMKEIGVNDPYKRSCIALLEELLHNPS